MTRRYERRPRADDVVSRTTSAGTARPARVATTPGGCGQPSGTGATATRAVRSTPWAPTAALPTFEGPSRSARSHPPAQGRKGPTMSRLLYRIGHFAGRHPWRVLAAWVLSPSTAFVLNSSFGGAPDETFRLPGCRVAACGRRHPGPLPAADAQHLQRRLPLRGRPHRPGRDRGRRRRGRGRADDGHARHRRQRSLRPARSHREQGRHHRLRHRGVRHREDRPRRLRRPPRRPSRPLATPASRSSTTAASATPR